MAGMLNNFHDRAQLALLLGRFKEKLMNRERKEYEGLEPTGSMDFDVTLNRRKRRSTQESDDKKVR